MKQEDKEKLWGLGIGMTIAYLFSRFLAGRWANMAMSFGMLISYIKDELTPKIVGGWEYLKAEWKRSEARARS